jgi:8-oxo-dGTP pyrophosphatase MutT (NUDIX family)/N-acetylglutamate synthase-like GNAT family acetyltransferase
VSGRPPEKVLLGLKKSGFGEGKYVGFGGKIEAGESIPQAARRELEEESGLRARLEHLEASGSLTFVFPHKPEWDHQVHLFLVRQWQGRVRESDELQPAWFQVGEIPYDRMWDDCRYWLPRALAGTFAAAHFTYAANNQTVEREFTISTEKSRLDTALIHEYLSNTAYWAKGRSLETVEKSIEHSLCFGVFQGHDQVGFARVVTDYVTFGWLCDVFILEAYQGQGLGKWLLACVIGHPELASLRILLLATRDAHEFYRKYGEFTAVDIPERLMFRDKTEP